MSSLHPLKAVAAADRRLELIGGGKGEAVRLRDGETGLWILIASEEGSIFDRWAADEGAPFLRLNENNVADGTEAILAAIETARLTADENRGPVGFQIVSGPSNSPEKDTQ